MKNELSNWFLPNFKGGLTAFYDLKDKIIVKADFYYYTSQKAKSYNPTDKNLGFGVYEKTIPGIFDGNLGLEYRYTKKLSIFLNVNNIASQKYYHWNNYPSQSINILGGFTYSFLED